MLKIKLIRFGQKNQPHYRIVIQEAKTKRDGKYTAKLGHYAPTLKPKLLEIDLDAYKKWLSKGAQPTDTVASLVKRFESGTPFPPKKKKLSKKKLAAQKAAAEVKTEEPKTEEPVVEKTKEEPKKEAVVVETQPAEPKKEVIKKEIPPDEKPA